MAEIDPMVGMVWGCTKVEIARGYRELIKRSSILRDCYGSLAKLGELVAGDSLEAAQEAHGVCEQLLAADTKQVDSKRIEQVRLKLADVERWLSEAAGRARDTDPLVTKLLAHSKELRRDLDALLDQEMMLGREMAETKDRLGGITEFRNWLQANCPLVSWDEAESLMVIAMDSELAARLDVDDGCR